MACLLTGDAHQARPGRPPPDLPVLRRVASGEPVPAWRTAMLVR
ncbi:hypothetical protein [Allorhizocola rhizosphaerae]|nr:hypothetical protein [Allorhizocola rhizosphaerae]